MLPVVLALFVCAALVYVVTNHTTKNINVTRSAIQYLEVEPVAATQTKIKIDGKLYRPLFSPIRFEGKISVEGYDFTQNTPNIHINSTMKNNGIHMGRLSYQAPIDADFMIKELGSGMIWFDERFEKMNIWTTVSWGQNDKKEPRMYIVTGDTYEQAMQNQNDMRERFGEGFVP